MLIYVRPGPLPAGENPLFQTLNLFRYYRTDIALRTDDDQSPATQAALRWARMRNLPVRTGGIPHAIVATSDSPPDTGRRSPDAARRLHQDAVRTSGEPPLRRFMYRIFTFLNPPSETVLWLDRSPEPAPDQNPGPPDTRDEPPVAPPY